MTHTTASLVFLIASACICVTYVAMLLFGPGRYTAWERVLYAPVYALSRVLWRVEIEWRGDWASDGRGRKMGFRERLLSDRMSGGAVLIANHRCSVDPFFVQLVGGRRVHWMVAGEYFRHFLFGPILRTFQAIPTNRGGVDTASTKRAIALAKSGRFVGMFPEGRINRGDSPLLTIRPGAAIVALRAGVPLVPIWIEGAPAGWEVYSALFLPAKVRIIVGTPERFDNNRLGDVDQNKLEESLLILANDPSLEPVTGGMANAAKDRVPSRSEAIEWISRVMSKSLTMGGYSADEVGIAGRKWLDN